MVYECTVGYQCRFWAFFRQMAIEIGFNVVLDQGETLHNIHYFSVFKLYPCQYSFFISFQITKTGDPICVFDKPLKKQPFERLYIACHNECDLYKNMPAEKFIYSIPSAIHSHKPPIQGTLQMQNCSIRVIMFIFSFGTFTFCLIFLSILCRSDISIHECAPNHIDQFGYFLALLITAFYVYWPRSIEATEYATIRVHSTLKNVHFLFI